MKSSFIYMKIYNRTAINFRFSKPWMHLNLQVYVRVINLKFNFIYNYISIYIRENLYKNQRIEIQVKNYLISICPFLTFNHEQMYTLLAEKGPTRIHENYSNKEMNYSSLKRKKFYTWKRTTTGILFLGWDRYIKKMEE